MSSRARAARVAYRWERFDDAALLRVRFRDLGLKLPQTAVHRDVELESALAQTDHDDPGSEFPDVADLLRG